MNDTSDEVIAVARHGALKLVKDAVVLVEVAELGAEIVVNANGAHRLAFHVHVPELEREIVARNDVAAGRAAKLDVADRRNDLAEERLLRRILGLFKRLGLGVAERRRAHVAELNRALGAAVHEHVRVRRVELGRRNHLGQLLHVGRLDVDNVERLVANAQIPQVDAQVVRRDERLPRRCSAQSS